MSAVFQLKRHDAVISCQKPSVSVMNNQVLRFPFELTSLTVVALHIQCSVTAVSIHHENSHLRFLMTGVTLLTANSTNHFVSSFLTRDKERATLSRAGNLEVKVLVSWLPCLEFEPSASEVPPCIDDHYALNISRLKRPSIHLNSSTFESDPDFVKTLIQNCIDERVSQNEREINSEQKIELAKLQLAQLEKEVELQRVKNKALSLNPAAKVEEKQFETNIENMIKSIKTLSLPVPTRSENFNLFFQSLERAFLTKKINDEYKSEILINLLGERAHNVLLYIKEEELNDYEKLKSIVLREFQLTPRECLNSFKNAVKSSGETYIQFAARLTANFQYYCSLRKVNSFESLCDLIISDKLFETLNKETATHIGIREAEDWFKPIDLAKECDIYISSRSGSHKEIPITYGYTQDPFKNRSQNFKPKVKENYPQYLERENKNCFICGDSSHCARDCEKRFKPKESNDHIHNKINVNTLKIESEKQNSEECANLQYVNIFVENQPVTALIDSGCQIPVLNSSLIRVQTPSEEIITLSSCFGEQRMVEVKPINISLNQHSPSLSVGTAISPTLTEEFIIHPSVYSEIKNIGHAKSDVLLNESPL
ncbi:transposon Tf2-6 polyprotein [Trichonephila clavipes]|nr:transposon Tf2-6 polyprotein [Trichonephila clavipes]